MVQLGRFHSRQQATIDCITIFWVGLIAEMLVDAGAADGSVNDTNRHVVLFEQCPGKLHPPASDLLSAIACSAPSAGAHGGDPTAVDGATVDIALTANPIIGVISRIHRTVWSFGEGIRLALQEVSIAAD